jgi:sterol desaturase/sphingolipid hydroxylase (fatty acid hydroxylase superfamily)
MIIDCLKVYITFVISYTLPSLLSFICDYNLIFEKFKIKNRTKDEYLRLYKKTILIVSKNVLGYSIPIIITGSYYDNLININYLNRTSYEYNTNIYDIPSQLLNLFYVFYYIVFTIFIYDVVFYTLHKFLHDIKFMKQIHNIHHEFKHPIAISAFYMHPIDLIFNIFPLIISKIVLNYNIETYLLFGFISIQYSILSAHSGYKDLSEKHDIHHSLYKYNYGTPIKNISMDYQFNTYYIKDIIDKKNIKNKKYLYNK